MTVGRRHCEKEGKKRSSLRAQSRRGLMTDSVRSAPPQSIVNPHSISEFKFAMTPEHIKPLLENAREVQVRFKGCRAELWLLLTHIHPSIRPHLLLCRHSPIISNSSVICRYMFALRYRSSRYIPSQVDDVHHLLVKYCV